MSSDVTKAVEHAVAEVDFFESSLLGLKMWVSVPFGALASALLFLRTDASTEILDFHLFLFAMIVLSGLALLTWSVHLRMHHGHILALKQSILFPERKPLEPFGMDATGTKLGLKLVGWLQLLFVGSETQSYRNFDKYLTNMDRATRRLSFLNSMIVTLFVMFVAFYALDKYS